MRLVLIAAVTLAVLAPAFAEEAAAPRSRANGMLDRLLAADANKDGRITRAEMRAAREQGFRAMDANNDGVISAEERQQLAAAAAAKKKGKGGGGDRTAGMDANGDGKITRTEFLNAPMRGFDRLDANDNDVVEAAEIEVARAMIARRTQVTP
jgi:hypothetical protein